MARILVIDDYPAILGLLQLTLTTAGHEVVTASDGVSGLALAERVHPDLVLVDVDMPEMDGVAVCGGLKRDPGTRDIPVLLMTGRLSAQVMDRGRRVGAEGVLPKPFVRARLLEEIQRVTMGV